MKIISMWSVVKYLIVMAFAMTTVKGKLKRTIVIPMNARNPLLRWKQK